MTTPPTQQDRLNLKYALKVFFIIGTGHNIDGITPDEFQTFLESVDAVYGKNNLQPIYSEAMSAGRDPLTAAAQNLYPPGINGTVNPDEYPAMDANVELVLKRNGL
jgi:hypothetical protein